MSQENQHNKKGAQQETGTAQPLPVRILRWILDNIPDQFFALLRNTRPNLQMPGNGPVFITRFRDVQEALSRPDIFNVTYAPMIDPSVGPFMLGRDCTTINQRDKGIMRSLIQREDMPRVRAMIAGTVNAQIQSRLQDRSIEVVSTLSRYVPMRTTADYFGFAGPDMESMFRWSRATQHDMFHNAGNDPQVHQRNIEAGREMKEWIYGHLLPQRREELKQNPELDDILSRLLKSKFPDAIHFDEERIVANLMGTLVGAGETTNAAVVQLLDQLFRRPKILDKAIAATRADDDALLYQYCWEALRFNPINPFVVRHCVQDYRIASGTLRRKRIRAGSTVLVSTRSAMRDGREIPAASQFAIDRPAYHYMHLGHGEHTCLGDQVSRVQVPEIVKGLLKLPGLRPAGPMDFQGGPFPEKYVLEFDPVL